MTAKKAAPCGDGPGAGILGAVAPVTSTVRGGDMTWLEEVRDFLHSAPKMPKQKEKQQHKAITPPTPPPMQILSIEHVSVFVEPTKYDQDTIMLLLFM